jgi:hypothetical protein
MKASRAWAALLLALLLAATTMAPAADANPPSRRIIGPEPEYFGDPDGPTPESRPSEDEVSTEDGTVHVIKILAFWFAWRLAPISGIQVIEVDRTWPH